MASVAHGLMLALVGAAGCNALFALDPPQRPDGFPSCEDGWRQRAEIAIHNASDVELVDHQVMLVLDTAAMLDRGELARDASDLRFVDEDGALLPVAIERAFATARTQVWIEIPKIPPGDSAVAMYFDAPAAAPWSPRDPFVEGVIANPSFEKAIGWSLEATGPVGFVMPSEAWASDGVSSAHFDAQELRHGDRPKVTAMVTQPVVFPEGSRYVVRFDLDVIAASNRGLGDNGVFFINIGGFNNVFWLEGMTRNITGTYLDLETSPIEGGLGTIGVGVELVPGHSYAYAVGSFDRLRLRRHADPQPIATIGPAEACR